MVIFQSPRWPSAPWGHPGRLLLLSNKRAALSPPFLCWQFPGAFMVSFPDMLLALGQVSGSPWHTGLCSFQNAACDEMSESGMPCPFSRLLAHPFLRTGGLAGTWWVIQNPSSCLKFPDLLLMCWSQGWVSLCTEIVPLTCEKEGFPRGSAVPRSVCLYRVYR